MNSHQFNEKLEKFRRASVETKVLKLLLAGHTNAEIARSRGRAEGTIRKQVSKIYQKFGIKSESSGDQSQRDELKALFRKHNHEWVSDCSSNSTNQISKKGQQKENDTGKPPSSTQDEDLMVLATKMLEDLGFNQTFRVTKSSGYVGYRFKNPQYIAYLLILSQQQDGLCISIPQYILEPYLLTLKYWIDGEELDTEEVIAGRFFVLPSKEDIFLESLHPNYWSIKEFVGKTVGSFYLNKLKKIHDDIGCTILVFYRACSNISIDEFNLKTLSASNSYLILKEDKLFPYTWQIYINSSEVLQEFLEHFGKILILDDGRPATDEPDVTPYVDDPDIPF